MCRVCALKAPCHLLFALRNTECKGKQGKHTAQYGRHQQGVLAHYNQQLVITARRYPDFSHHVMRPAATADQVTQQELGFLLSSSSSSLRQQHKQLR